MSGYGDKPFGLREVKLRPLDGGLLIDLPLNRVLKFREVVLSGKQRGWSKTVNIVTISDYAEFELEAGGISLEAYALMTGRTVTVSGTTPGQTSTLGGEAQAFPYFRVQGRAVSESGDVVCVLYKCKLTDGLSGAFQDGQFFMSATKGLAIDDGTNGIYRFVQQETAKAISPFIVDVSRVDGFDYVV